MAKSGNRGPYFGLRGHKLNVATIVLIVCPAFTCFGWNQAVLGGVLTLPTFAHQFPLMDTTFTHGAQKHYNSLIQGTVVSLYTIGAIFGALSCIYLGDVLGRRRTIALATLASMIGAILMASSFQFAQFIVARIILGLGTGGYTATVPVWQSEISKSTNRGAHVVTEGIFIGAGITLALWIDLGLYFVSGSSVSWRFPLALQIVLSLMVLAFIFTLPESPRWLLKKDRVEEARKVLAILDDVEEDNPLVARDIADIQRSIEITRHGSWIDMLKMGKERMLQRTILAATGQLFQQMCGINLITFYATTIFQVDLGLNATDSRILAAAMEVMQPIGAVICFFTIDRYGRRKLMMTSAAGMMCCMAILTGTTANPNNTSALGAAIAFLFLFNIAFPIGFLGITFLYATEVAPLHLRAAISGVSTATTWSFNFLVAEITPVGFDTIKNYYYLIYACIDAAIIPIVYLFFPETMGHSLEDMDQVFERSTNIFQPPRISRELKKARDHGGSLDPENGLNGGKVDVETEKKEVVQDE